MSVNEVKRAPPPTPIKIVGTTFSPSNASHVIGRTYAIGSEDHTLGNALRHVLLGGLPGVVTFSGYSVPHPSEEVMHLRVQVREGDEDGCDKVVREGCKALVGVCDEVADQIRRNTKMDWIVKDE